MLTFGEFIRKERKKLKLSQFELAEKAELTTNFISLIERDLQVPSVYSLEKLAKSLKLPVVSIIQELLPEVRKEMNYLDTQVDKMK